MKRLKWQIILGTSLVVVSAASYITQIVLFHRTEDTFFYMLQDFAFLPIQVSLVTLVINEVMQLRERSSLQHKMNMVIGTFFSGLGISLLRHLFSADEQADEMSRLMQIDSDWSDKDFAAARKSVVKHHYSMHLTSADLAVLKDMLAEERQIMLDLLANPSLLEHETFTDVLWAVSHLAEELSYRESLDNLPDSDHAHLTGDARRAYTLLASEWLSYAKHLKDQYPYMYSLLVRVNPFNPEASAVVKVH